MFKQAHSIVPRCSALNEEEMFDKVALDFWKKVTTAAVTVYIILILLI